ALLLFMPHKKWAQEPATDATSPLHLLQADYRTPYGIPKQVEIARSLDKVYDYLQASSPAVLRGSGNEITDYSHIASSKDIHFKKGDFRLVSYERGVTYAGMLAASRATGDKKYAGYTNERIGFLADLYPHFINLEKRSPGTKYPMRSILHPDALDD